MGPGVFVFARCPLPILKKDFSSEDVVTNGAPTVGSRKLRGGALSLVMLLLAACATQPRYQTVRRYIPPATETAKACLAPCSKTLDRCQASCQEHYQSCVKTLGPEAKARYAERLKQYETQLGAYRQTLDWYRMDLMLAWGWGPHWGGPWGGYYGWYPPSPPPPPPVAPTLAQEMARLSEERCDRDCGCQPVYDSCFLGCGGKIENETKCIANCPK
jgi:hypothetical protein